MVTPGGASGKLLLLPMQKVPECFLCVQMGVLEGKMPSTPVFPSISLRPQVSSPLGRVSGLLIKVDVLWGLKPLLWAQIWAAVGGKSSPS